MNSSSQSLLARLLAGSSSRAHCVIFTLGCSTLLMACTDSPDSDNTDMAADLLTITARPDLSLPDASSRDSGIVDAGTPDASPVDASTRDASLPDASLPDASVPDASVPDASVPDASVPDASVPDASVPDASVPDASVPDASAPDASVPDASVPDASIPDASVPDARVDVDFAGTSKRLRIMAANTSTGTKQSYDPGEGIRIFQGIKPDVALIQEFNYGDNSDTTIRGLINTTFGAAYYYYRETGAQIPNAVISRYPLIAAGKWTDPKVANRGFVWAHIDLPGSKDLWAVSVHLLTSSAANRNDEAVALVAELNKVVPAGDYIVIGGDLNSGTRTEACLGTFASIVSTSSPYPADGLGNDLTSAARSKPHDWVMPSPNLRLIETSVVIGMNSFANGLVVDSRVYTPLSDITPVMLGDSGAVGMQHMAVVEDFLLP